MTTTDLDHVAFARRRPPNPSRGRARCANRTDGAYPSDDDRFRLAVAIARPGERAQVLVPDGHGGKRSDGHVNLLEAVESGRSFLVTVAANRLALDADTPQQVDALAVFAGELRAVGTEPVVTESGRGRHLFAAVRAGERPMWMWRARQMGIDARETIRPPLAPHPNGLAVTLVGCTVDDALAALGGPATAGWPLSERLQALLSGNGIERGSRSEAIQTLAVGMYGANWTVDEFRTAIMRSPTWRRVVAEKGGRDWVERSWMAARRFVEERRDDERRELFACIRLAEQHLWTGRPGPTDQAVLRAHLDAAYQRGSVRHVLSIEDAAIAAGVSDRTAVNSRHRLEGGGWLTINKVGGGEKATEWAVTTPPDVQSCVADITAPHRGVDGCASSHDWFEDMGHDAYRWGAMGKRGLHVLATLSQSDEPLTAAEIARRLKSGTHASTVSRILTTALAAGLIEGAPRDGWRLVDVPIEGLERVAAVRGTTGRRMAAITARETQRAHRRRERGAYCAKETTEWVEQVAPFLPVVGRPTKMIDPATGEVLDRREQFNRHAEPHPTAALADTSLPSGYFEGDLDDELDMARFA
ncbi:MAG: helix-turn-helix domain-containing protein [Acidimicrobiales bacterium]